MVDESVESLINTIESVTDNKNNRGNTYSVGVNFVTSLLSNTYR